MTKQRKAKLLELLELMKEKNTDGRMTEACSRLNDIINEDDDPAAGDSNPGGTPPPPPGGGK